MGTALITGASSGLGLDFSHLFGQAGHSVVLVARRRDLLQETANKLRASYPRIAVEVIDMDLATTGAGRSLYQRVSSLNLQIDFLVNNAGFGSNGDFKDLPLKHELQMVDLNIRTVLELTHLFMQDMLARKSGRILNVGSTAGFQPGPKMSTYYATKAFVNSFTEGLHEELKGSGVSCTLLAPGPTATEFSLSAGTGTSPLFKYGGLASSIDVARAGYLAMLAGRAIEIPGLKNKILVQLLRLTPRFLIRKLVALVNQSKNLQ